MSNLKLAMLPVSAHEHVGPTDCPFRPTPTITRLDNHRPFLTTASCLSPLTGPGIFQCFYVFYELFFHNFRLYKSTNYLPFRLNFARSDQLTSFSTHHRLHRATFANFNPPPPVPMHDYYKSFGPTGTITGLNHHCQ